MNLYTFRPHEEKEQKRIKETEIGLQSKTLKKKKEEADKKGEEGGGSQKKRDKEKMKEEQTGEVTSGRESKQKL